MCFLSHFLAMFLQLMPYRVPVALRQLRFQGEKRHISLNQNLPKIKLDSIFFHHHMLYINDIRSDIKGRDRVKLGRQFLLSIRSRTRSSHLANILLLKYSIITDFLISWTTNRIEKSICFQVCSSRKREKLCWTICGGQNWRRKFSNIRWDILQEWEYGHWSRIHCRW